jgi:hypothetical protein
VGSVEQLVDVDGVRERGESGVVGVKMIPAS